MHTRSYQQSYGTACVPHSEFPGGATCWTSVPMRTTVGTVTHFVQISKECICRESSSIRARLRARNVQSAGLQPGTASEFRHVGPCENPGPSHRVAKGVILVQGGSRIGPGWLWQKTAAYRLLRRLPCDHSQHSPRLLARPRLAGRAWRIRQNGGSLRVMNTCVQPTPPGKWGEETGSPQHGRWA